MSESTERPPVPGFQPASALPRTQHVSSTSSHRDATNVLPPVPAAAPVSESEKEKDETPVAGPSKPVQRPTARKNAILFNAVQRRNPVRAAIKNVAMEIGDIPADYQVGTHNGVLFLSLKYHRLHPEYIHQRIEKMKNIYKLRVILVFCDINEHQQSLREITKIAIINEFTVFVAWSNEEVAQYLVSFKQQETSSAHILKEKIHQTYHNQLAHALTSGKKVNKTDADNLASQFGSFYNLVKQPSKVLSGVKGLGATKVNSLVDAFNKPFMVGGLKRADGTVRPASDLTASKEVSTSDRVDNQQQAESSTRNGTAEKAVVMDEEEDVGPIGSPDWPSDVDDEDGEEDERPVARGREAVPSRSPSPGSRTRTRTDGQDEVWRDPLDDDEDDDETSTPASKRRRES